MDGINMETNKVLLCIEGMNNVTGGFMGCLQKIENIQIADTNKNASYRKIKNHMEKICRELEKEQQQVKSMKNKLEEIRNKYINTEQKILNNFMEVGEKKKEKKTYGIEAEKGVTKEGNAEEMGYEEYLEHRRKNAVDENTRLLYEKYRKKVKIKDDSYDGTAHYNPFWNYIKYDEEADAENPRGVGCTYYHEIGHLIDDKSDWNSFTSTDWSYDFYDKLKEDLDNWVESVMKEQGYTEKYQAYDDMSTWLMTDADNKNGISDLVIGLTEGAAGGRWAHDLDYYTSKSIPKEAFAHFFEAGMSADPTKLDYIKKIFPSAYEEYQKMIKDELN